MPCLFHELLLLEVLPLMTAGANDVGMYPIDSMLQSGVCPVNFLNSTVVQYLKPPAFRRKPNHIGFSMASSSFQVLHHHEVRNKLEA